uniref:Taste receptor type 2 n=1 Tax=Nannospalax galili TaxID=1026970 RepID=A0A0N9NYB8_NANGA|nr:taste receptor type 2 member 10 [Nannospalax galili]ALG93269.1 taste receptor type 2 member 10 [Nannospalax galili]ALG93270.1 taste receptor type 2 member 10 [Nannospalax galili]ALG93271.1 taste receptor type 2 member 10 [Nannospalax galili]ALG93282.1 taste receptor type 2 member 10 [Nannospalax galili]
MPSTSITILMVIFSLMSLAAMLQNGFVIAVLAREWMRSRKLSAAEMIVASLASSRFCLHGTAVLNDLLAFFGFCYQANFLGIFWDFSNTLLLWFTACLAIFYCVKISSFSHPALSWLKWRISRLVPRLLLGSLVLGSLSAIISATGNIIATRMIISQGSRGNCTLGHKTLAFFWYYYLFHIALLWLTPFFLFLLSIILLMSSLYRHVGQMRNQRTGTCDPSTQAHTMALKFLAFFFIFYILFFLSMTISIMKTTTMQSYWYWAKEIIIYVGVYLHSIILVLSNPKLSKALKTRLQNLCAATS